MDKINFDLPQENESKDTHFYKKEFTKDGIIYVFDHVAVKIDTSGKNYKELPELFFSTFDAELKPGEALHQPEIRREGIDMAYIAQCIEEVSKDSGIHEFWFYPFGEDVSPKYQDDREQARLRLFQKLGNISHAPNGFGYILKI